VGVLVFELLIAAKGYWSEDKWVLQGN